MILVVLLGQPLFDQHVGAVTLLRILVVDQRVVERPDMARSLPRAGMHEDRRIEADDVLMKTHHRIPPVTLDIVLQLDAVLPVIVHGTQSVVYFAGRKDEAVLLAVGYQFFEKQKYKINGNVRYSEPFFLSLRQNSEISGAEDKYICFIFIVPERITIKKYTNERIETSSSHVCNPRDYGLQRRHNG